MWRCKVCGGENFEKTVETTEKFIVMFDSNGVEDGEMLIDDFSEKSLKCTVCGNSASIFNFIEDIANWEDEE